MEFSLLIIGGLLILQNTKLGFINCGKMMEYLCLKLMGCSVSRFILKTRVYTAGLWQRPCCRNARQFAALKRPRAKMGLESQGCQYSWVGRRCCHDGNKTAKDSSWRFHALLTLQAAWRSQVCTSERQCFVVLQTGISANQICKETDINIVYVSWT